MPCHTCKHLPSPQNPVSQSLTPSHTSSQLLTLHTSLTHPHKFSRLLTRSTPNSRQSTAQNRHKDIIQQTRHQQTVQCSLKHVQDSWRVCNSMYVCAWSSKLVHDSRQPKRHSSPPEETPAREERSRISHLTQSHRTPQTSKLRMSNLTLHDSSQTEKKQPKQKIAANQQPSPKTTHRTPHTSHPRPHISQITPHSLELTPGCLESVADELTLLLTVWSLFLAA